VVQIPHLHGVHIAAGKRSRRLRALTRTIPPVERRKVSDVPIWVLDPNTFRGDRGRTGVGWAVLKGLRSRSRGEGPITDIVGDDSCW
jgi:hypothetical protein